MSMKLRGGQHSRILDSGTWALDLVIAKPLTLLRIGFYDVMFQGWASTDSRWTHSKGQERKAPAEPSLLIESRPFLTLSSLTYLLQASGFWFPSTLHVFKIMIRKGTQLPNFQVKPQRLGLRPPIPEPWTLQGVGASLGLSPAFMAILVVFQVCSLMRQQGPQVKGLHCCGTHHPRSLGYRSPTKPHFQRGPSDSIVYTRRTQMCY